jgi:hypothetical protein
VAALKHYHSIPSRNEENSQKEMNEYATLVER